MSSVVSQIPQLKNGESCPLAAVPRLDFVDFRECIVSQAANGVRLASLFGQRRDDGVRLFAVLADSHDGVLLPLSADLFEDYYPALTPDCPQAHVFEREIAEQWGIVPQGHPWLKPVRYVHSQRPGKDAWGRADVETILPCVTDYFQVTGPEIHEVAVGPVHAGVIEPGSFRFQCMGEHVYHLEVQLGYQHRGVERAMCGGPNKRTLHYMETLAGDTSIGHGTAYCQILEGLAGVTPPPHAQAVRAIALELERMACHTGDLGALADDVGYLPTANYCGRLRGDFLNATGTICGNRFGRSLVRPGGVNFDIGPEMADEIERVLKAALRDVGGAAQLLWDSLSVRSRFENTGVVSSEDAQALGIVGMPLRATGIKRDVRQDFPTGAYVNASYPAASWPTGDVFARAYVRWLEIELSGEFVLEQLHTLPSGSIPRRHEAAGTRCLRRLDDRRMARTGLPRGNHRFVRSIRPVQSRRSVLSELDGPHACVA